MKLNRWFCIFSGMVFILAVMKIVLHLESWLVPGFFFAIGLVAALVNREFSLYLFFFLLPFINSSPGLFRTDYPFNYIAPALFLLSGMVTALLAKPPKTGNPGENITPGPLDRVFSPYYLFLMLLFISAVFVMLRWSNITLPGTGALGADTPVAPGIPTEPPSFEPQRVSFATIFPIISLFIYFISPFIYFYIKKISPRENVVFKWLSLGFYVSVGLAISQKISGRSLISDRLGKELQQFYGGFSDFNAFGFFSGVMFLWSTYEMKNKNPLGYITFAVSLVGTFLSGSRTAFFFLLAGVANLIYSALKDREKQERIVIIVLVAVVIAAVIAAGGTLKKRLSEGFSEDASLYDKVNAITNGRLWMTLFSLETVRDHFVSGIGTGNYTFYLAYKNYLPYKLHGEKYLYDLTLNHYLLVFTENGVLGFFFFTLFMILLYRRSSKKLLLGMIFFSLLLGNFFWFPEAFLLSWILAALTDTGKEDALEKPFQSGRKRGIVIIVSLVVFILTNLLWFSSLHPVTWAKQAGYRYDYGFWYAEKDDRGQEFRWTKERAGIYLGLDKGGRSHEIKIICGAPLAHLKEKQQKVEIYWKGQLYRSVVFTETREFSFQIESRSYEEGFLEIRVIPGFNLEKMGIGAETRELGVQFFPPRSGGGR